MSIQTIKSQVQNAEQYKIRAKTEAQQAEAIQVEQSAQKIQQQVDEYDKANPVGEQPEGIYSVSHDSEGNLKIAYKQPEANKQTMSVKANEKTEDAGKTGGAAPVATNNNEEDDDDNEDEIEKLKKQRDQIKQQLNRESDEKVKSQLRAQLQLIEMQIALKSAE